VSKFNTQAVLHELATHTLALAFFATHYGSLTDDFAYSPAIRNMHMSTMIDEDKREVGDCNNFRATSANSLT
jgi:DNA mismatch repair ATPase MutS